MPDVIAHEFVVIARNIDDLDAFMDAFQQLADDIVVRFRPIPAGFQPPTIYDIADQIDRIDVAMLEEIEQEACLATFCSQMQIGQEEGPDGEAVEMFFRHGFDSGREIMSLAESGGTLMTVCRFASSTWAKPADKSMAQKKSAGWLPIRR
jgi:hypothetical protein